MIILKNHFDGNDTAIYGDVVSNGCQTFHIHQLDEICNNYDVPKFIKEEVLKHYQENLGKDDITADILGVLKAKNNATLNNAVAFATTNERFLEKMFDHFKNDENYTMRIIIAERTDISTSFIQKLANDESLMNLY